MTGIYLAAPLVRQQKSAGFLPMQGYVNGYVLK